MSDMVAVPGVRFGVLLLGLGLPLAACGDNYGPPDPAPDASGAPRCAPTPPERPASGPFADPTALPLEGCVEGGLRDLPGRWFVWDGKPGFGFEYPKFAGTCEQGFRRANYLDDDHDDSDGSAFHTWSDGTRMYYRQYYRFEIPGVGMFEYAFGAAGCLRADGTMAALGFQFDTDRGGQTVAMEGKRFAPKDGAPVGLTLLGEVGVDSGGLPMPAYNVVVDGTHAYTVGPLGFDVIDVANPAAPAPIAHVDGDFNDVKLVRSGGTLVAFLSPLYSDTTSVIDVTDPANPVSAATIPEYSHSVFVETRGAATYLYLATYTDAVPRYDVTNPLAPVRLGHATVPGPVAGVHDLFVDGDRIYANNTTEGLVAFDVSGGLGSAVQLGRIRTSYSHASWVGTAGGRAVVLHGDEGMTESGGAFLRVLDGAPGAAGFMTELGRYQTRPEVGIHNFQLVGDKAYIAYYHDGVRVVDLSNPAQPREIAHYNTWDDATAPGDPFESALGIRVVGGTIYVADSLRGLMIFKEP
jgi:hypothetical protein